MAFKKSKNKRERLELVSLIDMIFILLVFFLVTSYVIRLPLQERSVYIPTPKNEIGRAQILIQIIDEENVFWLDETSASTVTDVEQRFGYLSRRNLQERVVRTLERENTLTMRQLYKKLEDLKAMVSEDINLKHFILIRCPYEVPYSVVLEIIAQLTDTPFRNLQYGCVAGSVKDIRDARNIRTLFEDNAKGQRRKNIQIDF